MSLARGAGHMTIWNRRLLGLAWQQRRAITAMVVLGLLVAATFVGQGLLVAHAIIGVLVDDRWQSVPPLLVAALALVLVRGALMWWREALGAAVGDRAAADLRRRLYRKITVLGPAWLQSTRTGTVQTTLSTSVDALESPGAAVYVSAQGCDDAQGSLGKLYTDVKNLGTLPRESAKAEALVADMQKRVADAKPSPARQSAKRRGGRPHGARAA
jgi:hypothetical protein